MRTLVLCLGILVLTAGCAGTGTAESEAEATPAVNAADRVHVTEDSDAQAIEIAQKAVEAMGGWEAWDNTRYVRWNFFGGRRHYWDRETNDIRIEMAANPERQEPEGKILMNIDSKQGRAWMSGNELTDPEQVSTLLDQGHQMWVNDAYWMFMPFKLLDPGVTLKYKGEESLEDGRAADVITMTFADGVGYTPQNRYDVFVAKDTGLVEAWAFYASSEEPEPRFNMPWADWQTFGDIKIATQHGQGRDWQIAVFDDLPRSVFEEPTEVEGESSADAEPAAS